MIIVIVVPSAIAIRGITTAAAIIPPFPESSAITGLFSVSFLVSIIGPFVV
jgi:hypothetical protein